MAATSRFTVLARSFSAAASQSVKPPVAVFGVEGRYATAVYSAATRMNQLDKVEKDLVELQTVLQSNRKLQEILISPIINRKELAVAMKSAMKTLKMSEATANLMDVLAENGRFKKLGGIVNNFKLIMAAHRGDIVCKVITAKPLDAGQKKELESALKKFVKEKEKIELVLQVDPELIGGMIVSIDDKFIDMSIATKVKMYSDLISQPA